jgi:hypothetical protein
VVNKLKEILKLVAPDKLLFVKELSESIPELGQAVEVHAAAKIRVI